MKSWNIIYINEITFFFIIITISYLSDVDFYIFIKNIVNTTQKTTFFSLVTIFILFVVLNLFFLSILSIGLYKFICYDKQNELLQIDLLFKASFVCFFDDNKQNIFSIISPVLCASWNQFFLKK